MVTDCNRLNTPSRLCRTPSINRGRVKIEGAADVAAPFKGIRGGKGEERDSSLCSE